VGGGAVKRLDREFYHSAFYSIEVRNRWNYSSTLLACLYGGDNECLFPQFLCLYTHTHT